VSTFVVPDAHGNSTLVRGLLIQEEIIDDKYERVCGPDVQVIQLGDLANCVAESINADRTALDMVGPIFDFMLVGNHEHPYLGGPPFSGFWSDPELQGKVRKLYSIGLMAAAACVDGIVLTHAGIPRDIGFADAKSPAEWAQALNDIWLREPRHEVFSRIGYSRGGWAGMGSILWRDWSEPISLEVPQICGHTVDKTWRAHYGKEGLPSFWFIRPYEEAVPVRASAICLDIGAGKKSKRILGAWIEEGTVRIVEHKREH
jgi:alkylhydroperoxidase/carboxymuconolactone decarboxylase family protein YurZ